MYFLVQKSISKLILIFMLFLRDMLWSQWNICTQMQQLVQLVTLVQWLDTVWLHSLVRLTITTTTCFLHLSHYVMTVQAVLERTTVGVISLQHHWVSVSHSYLKKTGLTTWSFVFLGVRPEIKALTIMHTMACMLRTMVLSVLHQQPTTSILQVVAPSHQAIVQYRQLMRTWSGRQPHNII